MQKIINLVGSEDVMIKIIDLSQEIFQGMPVYPGHVKTVIWDHHTHKETGKILKNEFSYASKGLLLSDHGPTHVDALNHMDPSSDAASIDELPLEKFYTSAICLNVSHVPDTDFITVQILEEACRHADLQIQEGDTVLLYTGHFTRNYGSDQWLEGYTGLDYDATKWLAQKGVVNIGIDAPSVDNPMDRTYPSHNACKQFKVLNTENLGDLQRVISKRFQFIGFPLKIRGGTGSPVRAVAILND
jgi:kynurenine formamidase